jgi:dihydrofolate reductase
MGQNGILLHNWLMASTKTADETAITDELLVLTGAVILGGKTYKDAIDDAWDGETPFHVPAFVVMNSLPNTKKEGFNYVLDGIVSALNQAREVAGEKDIWLMGGANLVQQYLQAGLVDEIRLHVAPILLGSGIRLFDKLPELQILEQIQVIETLNARHLYYRLKK